MVALLVELTVHGLNGETLAILHCPLSCSVYEVKQRLACHSRVLVGQQQLTLGCDILEDHKTLESCGISTPQALLQCVRIYPSGVACHLEAQRGASDPNEALQASLADIVDPGMQAAHEQSQRYVPCASDIMVAMSTSRREEVVGWMVQAFEALHFSDDILHSTIFTLDRYCAKLSTRLPDEALQKTVLAAAHIHMKLASCNEFPPGHRQRVIAHLAFGRLEVSSILRTEVDMLSTLEFVVEVPTPLTFLEVLGLRIQEDTPATEAAQWRSSALFLLELAFADPQVQYQYSHAVLAAAALCAALRTCGAPMEKHEHVLEDLSSCCPVSAHTDEAVAACEEELLTLWLQSSRNENNLGSYYTRLEAKFSQRARHRVARLSPEAALQRRWQEASPSSTPPSSRKGSRCPKLSEAMSQVDILGNDAADDLGC